VVTKENIDMAILTNEKDHKRNQRIKTLEDRIKKLENEKGEQEKKNGKTE